MEAKPTAPATELAARVQQWIDELPEKDLRYWAQRVCKERNALPLLGTPIYFWALRPDGVVLCIDYEAFTHPTEPETDPLRIYAALVHGSRIHPELSVLIPAQPPGVQKCEPCDGAGYTTSAAQSATACVQCDGLGWRRVTGSLPT